MKNNKELKEIPIFNSEEEEREFWETHDSTEYINWNSAINASKYLKNLKQLNIKEETK